MRNLVRGICSVLVLLCLLCTAACAVPELEPEASISPPAAVQPAQKYSPPAGVEFTGLCSSLNSIGALDSQGRVYIWSRSGYDWEHWNPPPDLPPIKQLDLGQNCAVALDFDGNVYAWGVPEHGECDFPEDLPPIKSIAVSGYKVMLLTEAGDVLSFGNTNYGEQSHVPELPPIVEIACSAYVSAARDANGTVYAWGIYEYTIPEGVASSITVGTKDILALDEKGNLLGEIDPEFDSEYYSYYPTPITTGIKKLVSFYGNAAAIDFEGNLFIWGYYEDIPESHISVPEGLPPIADVIMGHYSVICLGEDGNLYQWGKELLKISFNGQQKPTVQEMMIPDVCWNTPAYAYEVIRGLPIEIREVRYIYAPDVTPGMVVGQWPLPGNVPIPPEGESVGMILYISTNQ